MPRSNTAVQAAKVVHLVSLILFRWFLGFLRQESFTALSQLHVQAMSDITFLQTSLLLPFLALKTR